MESLRGHGLFHCYLTLISLIYISEFEDPYIAIFVDKKTSYLRGWYFFCNLPAQVNVCQGFYVLFFVSNNLAAELIKYLREFWGLRITENIDGLLLTRTTWGCGRLLAIKT